MKSPMGMTLPGDTAAARLPELPSLVVLLGQIQEQLSERRQLGLLSITVLSEGNELSRNRWSTYEAILKEISVFLTRFQSSRLRQSDVILDPLVAGNTFVVLLGPPREERALDKGDLTRVRHRLSRGIKAHLGKTLPADDVEKFGVYLGGALMSHDEGVDTRRIIYGGLEQAFADGLGQREREERTHAIRLHRLLRSEQVKTVYQPVVDLVAQRILGYEALTRIPNGAFQTPDRLFKVARDNGALWAVERLCRKKAIEGLPTLESGQRLFLNIEPDSFSDPQLQMSGLPELLRSAGLTPDRVVFELTEHSVVQDFGALREFLDEVRSIGYQLAMDDVGSGYAGLQAIAEIRPDFLKVDMSLVRDLHLDPIKRELIRTIRRFTDNTSITLIAEGVEQQAELEKLAEAGVRCAQGYLFARPDSPPEIPDWENLVVSES
ncbi:MAG: EAL domain-containing protein [Acidobacteriota bacterium]|nr:EAL domain-containing protein [Acidobacteriota bacterium]MDH3786184.1 EAL domain-containing protein [Acidobacteriota bacterium]